MTVIENRLYRLSINQLKALKVLAQSEDGVISSTASGFSLHKHGKSLGGIYSSLSRQIIDGEHLVLPWGRGSVGQGLRWKLNTKLISKERVIQITKELLK